MKHTIKSHKSLTILSILSLAFLLAVTSCASTAQPGSADNSSATENSDSVEIVVPEKLKDFDLTTDNVKLLGRTIIEKGQILMCYSSTGAEFNVNAKYLEVTFGGDSGVSSNTDNAARVVVFVNGERLVDEMLTQRSSTFTVFNKSEPVEALVQVIKVSECANSLASIQAITTDSEGLITPAPARDLKIEFIGDSITCGYGVDDLDRNHHFKTSTEDNTKTYAYKTAAALNADYSMVSLSGWGIVSGYSGDGTKNKTSALPPQYSKLGYSWGSTIASVRPQTREWDFSLFQPDFVVVNLGTNDASYTKGNEKKIGEYKDGYVDFLKDIRAKNPSAKIICSLGIMGADLYPALEEAVADYKAATGDDQVYALRFANQNMADGIAADWHPSEKTHEKAAALLVNYINGLKF